MAMSIAKRLSLACAGVVVGALGFFAPRANAGLMIDMEVDPNPASKAGFTYVMPTYNNVTHHWEIQGADTVNNKFVLFDVVATVTGSQVNASMPARSATPLATAEGGTASPYVPSFLSEGVSYASGTVSLTGATALLDTVSPKYAGGSIAAGLVAGDRGAATSQTVTYTPNYGAEVNGTHYSGVLKSAGTGNGYIRSIGPLSGDAEFTNPNSYINANAISDARFDGGLFGIDDGINPPSMILTGDPTAPSSRFTVAKVSLFFGTLGAQSGGTLNIGFIPVGTNVNANANAWVEDYITGLHLDGQNNLIDTGDGRGYYVTTTTKIPSGGGFTWGTGVSLDVIVPEPATLGLFAVGALVCGLRRNRRK